jgi:hypothetical protein
MFMVGKANVKAALPEALDRAMEVLSKNK